MPGYGCSAAGAAVAGGECGVGVDGDDDGAKTMTLTNRVPASRSTAFGKSAEWPRQAAHPQTTCSPVTYRRRPASTSYRAHWSVTRYTPNRPIPGVGRDTR